MCGRGFFFSIFLPPRVDDAEIKPNLQGTGWKYVDGAIADAGLPDVSAGAATPASWGPVGDGAKVYDTLDEMFIALLSEDVLEKIANWSTYYAALQPVTKRTSNGGKRVTFTSCDVGADGQQYRCGGAEASDNFQRNPITKWHVLMVMGCLLRGTLHCPPATVKMPTAACALPSFYSLCRTNCTTFLSNRLLRLPTSNPIINYIPSYPFFTTVLFTLAGATRASTPLAMWVDYENCYDPSVADHVSKEHFLYIMKWLAFADYDDLQEEEFTDKDGNTKTRMVPDAKVAPFLDLLQQRFRDIWDMGQCVTVDEACCKSKSRYCTFKQRNPAKPIRMHIKIYVAACSQTAYLHSFCVYKGAGSGSTAKIIVDDLFDPEWKGTSKVLFMDNYFADHDLQFQLHDKHGAFCVTTVSLPSRGDEAQAKIDGTKYPFRAPPKSVSSSLERGFTERAESKHTTAHGEYTSCATLWMDTKLLGVKSNCLNGIEDTCTVSRRLRKHNGADTKVRAFEAVVHYLAYYGAVDRLDASMRVRPTDFRTQHWYRRLFYWGMDALCHNMWVILQQHTGEGDDKDQPEKDRLVENKVCYCQDKGRIKKSKRKRPGYDTKVHTCYNNRDGLGGRTKFHLDLSAAVIKRAAQEIEDDPNSFTVTPRRKRKEAPAKSATSPFKKRRVNGQVAFKHNAGKHTFQQLSGRGECFPCKQLAEPKKKKVQTGCKKCKLRKGACGVFICKGCWDLDQVRRWHESGCLKSYNFEEPWLDAGEGGEEWEEGEQVERELFAGDDTDNDAFDAGNSDGDGSNQSLHREDDEE